MPGLCLFGRAFGSFSGNLDYPTQASPLVECSFYVYRY